LDGKTGFHLRTRVRDSWSEKKNKVVTPNPQPKKGDPRPLFAKRPLEKNTKYQNRLAEAISRFNRGVDGHRDRKLIVTRRRRVRSKSDGFVEIETRKNKKIDATLKPLGLSHAGVLPYKIIGALRRFERIRAYHAKKRHDKWVANAGKRNAARIADLRKELESLKVDKRIPWSGYSSYESHKRKIANLDSEMLGIRFEIATLDPSVQLSSSGVLKRTSGTSESVDKCKDCGYVVCSCKPLDLGF
jgi:hypothetical protein